MRNVAQDEKGRWKTLEAAALASKPIPTRFSVEMDQIIRSLPNRSDKLRQWVREGMIREGLLVETAEDA